MFASTFTALLLVLTVTAWPSHVVVDKLPISLSLAHHLNVSGPFENIADTDRARAKSFKSWTNTRSVNHTSKRDVWPVPLANTAVSYTVNVSIGTPSTNYTLLVDTGSSLTWVGAGKPYNRTSSSQATNDSLELVYGSGIFTGQGFLDTITLGNLTVLQQFIGVTNLSNSGLPTGLDGILGLGPTDLNEGISLTNFSATFPTVTDNAFKQSLLDSDEVGMLFEPTTSDSSGMLAFGGVNSSALNGSITTVPITSTMPSTFYIGINQSITYGNSSPSTSILGPTAGIMDAGTTLILIATDAYQSYQEATNATLDADTGLLKLPATQADSLQSLFFHIGGMSFEFTKNAQIWPTSLNCAIGGDNSSVYLIVNDIGTLSGEGLDFINGYAFMQRFYTVYNSQNSTFGIATTSYTTADTN
ncbi:uncharacterized protein PHACADRAFT_208375 [Phanerochaete carnosa HHB-10118-sp]|uniref:Peptidase A1 domain-containing protein n=1 Tax=Phanerochaete carnosa (strain HHB-10118-sp) TaxID=650164 RepID=K5WDZ9_PHACS|nr:uncharacterized protein PHACADRAFT_208375 [Phanerochaete carnosa HHB-10118-sp]EKM57274.1 hypothetical protein PHACADRAFT_208375 [Phanerochaete carnosa HHB-10118-sp]